MIHKSSFAVTAVLAGSLLASALLACLASPLAQSHKALPANPVEIPLWQGAPPDAGEARLGFERDITTPRDELVGDRPVIRLANVTLPTLKYFPPREIRALPGNATGRHPALVVLPGGGYTVLAYDLEGTEVCDWATGLGMACVLVKYRVPASGPYPKVAAALQDAQRALAIVHEHAAQWELDPDRIGVAGFSAGAHLAVALANTPKLVYRQSDGPIGEVFKPAFLILLYPAYLTKAPHDCKLKPELMPNATASPAFLVQSQDDPVHVENALAYARALTRHRVPVELHIYARGGHGFGLRETSEPVTHWTTLAALWLHSNGVLPGPQ